MTYTIQDFGPADLLSSERVSERRVKTSSMSAADTAAINGKLYSIAAPYSVPSSESQTFNIDLSGLAIIYLVEADGLEISVNSEASTGVSSDISAAYKTNFTKTNGFSAYAQKMNDFTQHGDTPVSCSSPCAPSIVADESTSFAVTITNNYSDTVSGFLNIKMESLGEYITPFGISGSDSLEEDTEMSIYL